MDTSELLGTLYAIYEKEQDKGQVMSGFLSKHINSDKKYNESNTGIGYRSKDGWTLGTYQNSLNKPSYYAGKEWQSDEWLPGIRGGIGVGGVSGYNKSITPYILPQLLFGSKENQLALGLVPPIPGTTPATLALQYRKSLK